jgi:hypothetical protein
VVEGDILPGAGLMTGGAIAPKLTVMAIILFMTGETISGCVFVNIINVTLLAFYACMLAIQFEHRQVVIKFGRLPSLRRMAG